MNDSNGLLLGIATLVLFLVVYVWFALALAAVFAKTGEKTWKAWIPVLNVATVLGLGGFSPWLVLLNLVPLFGGIAFIVVFVVAVHRVNAGFDRGAGMTVLGAIIPLVWASILGFGSARWQGAAPARSGRVDENSAPVRRGRDFDGPYVPLVGGWTPEPAPPAADPAPMSEPVALPFAAPSSSLADAVPAPLDWAPPSPGSAFGASPAAPSDDPAPPTSVFDVLEALRAEPRPTTSAPSDASAAERAAEPVVPAFPVVPAAPTRGYAAPSTPPVAQEQPVPVDEAASEQVPAPAVELAQPPVEPEPWGRSPRRTGLPEAPAPIADVPLTRPAAAVPEAGWAASEAAEEFPELSEAVSAVSEAPDAGAPRSARTSVSALYTQPELPDDDVDALDRTVVTRRRRIPWALVPPSGAPVDLTSHVVILGRRPAPDQAYPDAQLVPISDETRTVSKTHARLELRGETWYVTDLDSTNGVLFATLMGTEVEAPPGEEIEAGERFFLGDAEVRLARREA